MKLTNDKTVKALQEEFAKETTLFLRIYKGNKTANEDTTLNELKVKEGDVEFSTKMKIKTIEDNFKKLSLKIQIASADNRKLCNDDYTLAKAIKKYGNKEDLKESSKKENLQNKKEEKAFRNDKDADVKDDGPAFNNKKYILEDFMKKITVTPVYHLDTNNGRDEEKISDTSVDIDIDLEGQKSIFDDESASYSLVEAILKNKQYVDFLSKKYDKVRMPEYSYFRVKYIKIDDNTYDLEECNEDLFDESAMKWFDGNIEATYI